MEIDGFKQQIEQKLIPEVLTLLKKCATTRELVLWKIKVKKMLTDTAVDGEDQP
jgi:hypothetical protein